MTSLILKVTIPKLVIGIEIYSKPTHITINQSSVYFSCFGNVHLSNESFLQKQFEKRLRAPHSHKRGNITTRESVKLSFLHLRSWGERAQAEIRMAGKWQANGPRRQGARARAGVFAAASNIHQRAVAHSKTNQHTNLFHAGHFAAEFVSAAFCCRPALNK